MKWLRIELLGERLDLFFIERVCAAGKALSHSQLLEVMSRGRHFEPLSLLTHRFRR